MMALGGATIARLFRMVELMNSGRIPNIMGVDDGVPIHYSLAEIQVRGTDRLHRTHEHKNVDSDRKKT